MFTEHTVRVSPRVDAIPRRMRLGGCGMAFPDLVVKVLVQELNAVPSCPDQLGGDKNRMDGRITPSTGFGCDVTGVMHQGDVDTLLSAARQRRSSNLPPS